MEDVQVTATPAEVEEFLRPMSGSGSGSGYGYGSGSGYCYGAGDGSGSGYGYGAGDGSGDGYGYGDGSGSGSGYGDGDGSGYGYGSGYGSGYGDGSGSGSGSGSGYGYGDGYGIKAYNGHPVHIIDGVETIIAQVNHQSARGFIINSDLTLRPCWVFRVNDCYAHGDTLREAARDAVAKWEDTMPVDEKIKDFLQEFPFPDEPVRFETLYERHHFLTGSCAAGRDAFVKDHAIDTSKAYTVRYFLSITANAYGGEVIRQLAEAYGINLDTPCST